MYNLLTHSAYKMDKSLNIGYYSPVLYLSPSKLSGVNYCPAASGGCIASCLQYSGRMHMTAAARMNRSKLLNNQPEQFHALLVADVKKAVNYASKKGLLLAVRPDGTSDRDWCELYESFPDTVFYGYTKVLSKILDNKHHNLYLTFSRSENNWHECLQVLDAGYNVAVVFDTLPDTYEGYQVIDGDAHDLRFLDPEGVIVGLKAKGRARHDKTGFVVRVQS